MRWMRHHTTSAPSRTAPLTRSPYGHEGMVSYTLRGVTRRFSPSVRLAGVGVAGEPLGWQNGHEESCRGFLELEVA